MYTSTGVAAIHSPDKPPTTNNATNPSANNMLDVSRMRAPWSVASQLKVLIELGSAIAKVESMNAVPAAGLMPDTNMWCPHTTKPSTQIALIESTIGLYPNTGLRPCTARTSDTMPIAGNTITYTAGWL